MSCSSRALTSPAAAKYFGCSAAHLRSLRRLGWLKAVEDKTTGTRRPFPKCHFTTEALDRLAWDYLLSLSLYDIYIVRFHGSPADALCQYRGIPLSVVKLIRKSVLCEMLAGVIGEYARVRGKHLSKRRKLVHGEHLQSLAVALRRFGFDTFAHGRRREMQTAVINRRWPELVGPATVFRLPAAEIFGPGSATARPLKPRGTSADGRQ